MVGAVVLWRERSFAGELVQDLRCTVEQLGEGVFELRVRSGPALVVDETCQTTAEAARRAEQLRIELTLRPAAGGRR